MKLRSNSGYVMRVLILQITCASLVGCSVISPVAPRTQCLAVEPVLISTTVNDESFIIPIDEMGQLTAYIEQLRQCVEVVSN